MDFGLISLDNGGLMCSGTTTTTTTTTFSATSDAAEAAKSKLYGSGFLKQERSWTGTEDDLRDLKVGRISASSSGQQMLSFSSPNSQTVTLPYYHPSSIAYSRNVAGLNAASMHGVLSGIRGPFTPSQWMELEHQALIYKYINANVPIPSYLLTPIRKALDCAGFTSFAGLRPNAFGWGAFHLGFSNSNDPEPGRCRRTDGKKWRCSRDAVADQKYCERHMNRGRHRSRKPVEGQTGHSVAGITNAAKLMPNSSASAAAVVPGGLTPHHQLNNPQAGATNTQCATSPHLDRNFLGKDNSGGRFQDTTTLPIISSSSINLKESQYPISKPHEAYVDSSRGEFGQVCSDSLLNPLDRSSSLVNCSNYGTSEDVNDQDNKTNSGLRQFMDDWPNNRTERSAVSWPDIDMHSDNRTQLSISISMAGSDFMSSTSSPTNEKVTASPLSLSRELEATHMGLGVGTIVNERSQRQANWIPISWESSMGGPLAEVLHSTNNNTNDSRSSSALNLMTEGWEGSPQLASSPTGVLQKSTFMSRSNSSNGSSPRAVTSKAHEGVSLCSGVFGPTLMNPALPAL
ncbi:OLC1v1017021C2 [Oldenlandia corymbosa var. corymbosa]|uniref:Growth-regulating factor n=1 Tax=Oldenlandia corymbosa var. corymbosa TaxID=529605 RepID=A0AAV1E8H2_OLDCO|nr:OLC1v1017021C2 [Oldenlandia corymbosa var. corymbosa]